MEKLARTLTRDHLQRDVSPVRPEKGAWKFWNVDSSLTKIRRQFDPTKQKELKHYVVDIVLELS